MKFDHWAERGTRYWYYDIVLYVAINYNGSVYLGWFVWVKLLTFCEFICIYVDSSSLTEMKLKDIWRRCFRWNCQLAKVYSNVLLVMEHSAEVFQKNILVTGQIYANSLQKIPLVSEWLIGFLHRQKNNTNSLYWL